MTGVNVCSGTIVIVYNILQLELVFFEWNVEDSLYKLVRIFVIVTFCFASTKLLFPRLAEQKI